MSNNVYSINQIMTLMEASERYNLNYETLRNKFKIGVTSLEKISTWVESGLVRKSGKTWLVSDEFITKVVMKQGAVQ